MRRRPRFSNRADFEVEPSALAQVFAGARAAGEVLDLTETNPTRVGLSRARPLVAALGDAAGARYEPEPFGTPSAREAVAAWYAERGHAVSPCRVVLGASTSEAYGVLFKLLADAGDDVLVPAPSYPLFSYLARLEGVETRTYPLLADEGFRLDLAAIERSVGPRTRAIVVVHPNNPTGTLVREDDAAALDALAASKGLAILSDEVFLEFVRRPFPAGARGSFFGPRRALTFVLGGLSKALASPQLKLGWTIACGPDEDVVAALARLEVIADTYLSVSTPVQVALSTLLAAQPAVRDELMARIDENRAALDRAVAAASPLPVRVLPSHGGWLALLEVPRIVPEAEWVTRLACERGVLVQPGYFFDLDDGGTLVLSLIPEPPCFAEGVARVLALVRELAS